MAQGTPDTIHVPVKTNPYTLPADRHGWRGLSVPGHHKRKVYTILHNQVVLVTGLLVLPGEVSIRHSHESGELSIHYVGHLQPRITWNPPGFVHGGAQVPREVESVREAVQDHTAGAASTAEIAALLAHVGRMEEDLQRLKEEIERLTRPEPEPRLLIDILFPPFKTTIEDPLVERKTVVGQWFD